MSTPNVAMIGSFRRHLGFMKNAIDVFSECGIDVVNPIGTTPLKPDAEFVRFAEDGEDDDITVQRKAIKRILGAKAVYVVCPEGYVGKTTAYEWGWVEAHRRPAYFSHVPDFHVMTDVAMGRIVTPVALAELILADRLEPLPDLTAEP
jgi:hypothetical protein